MRDAIQDVMMLFGAILLFLSRASRLAMRHVSMSNQFKIADFTKLECYNHQGVLTFNIMRLNVKDRIGHGSFGKVFTADFSFTSEHAAETVVVKKAIGALDSEEKKLFLKQVALAQ